MQPLERFSGLLRGIEFHSLAFTAFFVPYLFEIGYIFTILKLEAPLPRSSHACGSDIRFLMFDVVANRERIL